MMSVDVTLPLRDFDLDVRFEAPSGSCVALVGPTGCGKTTTLRIIAGLLTPSAGRVEMDGLTLLDTERGVCLAPQRRRLGVVFQEYALFPHMTVLRNVLYGCMGRRGGRAAAQERARAIVAQVHLAGYEHVKPDKLSCGQQQRVAIARALAGDPHALLMDEPMAALDPVTHRRVRRELRRIITATGKLTVLVTHDVVDALSLADVVCVMDRGSIVQTGRREELLARPRNRFVAEFLGLNLLECHVTPGRDGVHRAQCGSTVFHTTDEVAGEALLTCAPWDVFLSLSRPESSAMNVLHGRISDISHVGGRTRVTVENGVAITAEVTHDSEQRLGLRIGQEIYAGFKASAARAYR